MSQLQDQKHGAATGHVAEDVVACDRGDLGLRQGARRGNGWDSQ
ncbi:hypothetical protein [Amycolatopsis sp. cmx-11-51]